MSKDGGTTEKSLHRVKLQYAEYLKRLNAINQKHVHVKTNTSSEFIIMSGMKLEKANATIRSSLLGFYCSTMILSKISTPKQRN